VGERIMDYRDKAREVLGSGTNGDDFAAMVVVLASVHHSGLTSLPLKDALGVILSVLGDAYNRQGKFPGLELESPDLRHRYACNGEEHSREAFNDEKFERE
jgi:hypothetical protein